MGSGGDGDGSTTTPAPAPAPAEAPRPAPRPIPVGACIGGGGGGGGAGGRGHMCIVMHIPGSIMSSQSSGRMMASRVPLLMVETVLDAAGVAFGALLDAPGGGGALALLLLVLLPLPLLLLDVADAEGDGPVPTSPMGPVPRALELTRPGEMLSGATDLNLVMPYSFGSDARGTCCGLLPGAPIAPAEAPGGKLVRAELTTAYWGSCHTL